MTNRRQRVVVRPPNWLGDAVMALPALAAVRHHFADAHLTVAAVPAVAAIFREDSDTRPDAIIELAASSREITAMLQGEGFDTGVLFPNSWRSAWQFWRAGVRERWGYATSGRGLLLTHRARRVRGVAHQADYYRQLVSGLGITCEPAVAPRLEPRASSVEQATSILSTHRVPASATLVGFAPGAAYGQAKQWPPDRVAAVAARLARDRGVTCLVLGASHDRDAARAIESWLRANAPDTVPHVVNLAGRTSLRTLVGIISRTSVFVSNDSGAMHLAAALGKPVVAVFGPTNERATRPIGDHHVLTASVFCRPCMLRDCPIDHRCMKRIGIDDVYGAVIESLTQREAR